MCAVYQNTASVSYHGNNIAYFNLQFNTDGTTTSDGKIITESDEGISSGDLALIHGWLMWVAWGLFGFVQIASNRYLKFMWRIHIWIHRIAGSLIMLITIALGIVGIKIADWELESGFHTIIGLIVFFVVTFITLGGIFAKSMTMRLKWKTNVILRV